jgi:hypothetical protein
VISSRTSTSITYAIVTVNFEVVCTIVIVNISAVIVVYRSIFGDGIVLEFIPSICTYTTIVKIEGIHVITTVIVAGCISITTNTSWIVNVETVQITRSVILLYVITYVVQHIDITSVVDVPRIPVVVTH